MVVGTNNNFLHARIHPSMVLIKVAISDGIVTLTAPEMESISFAIPSQSAEGSVKRVVRLAISQFKFIVSWKPWRYLPWYVLILLFLILQSLVERSTCRWLRGCCGSLVLKLHFQGRIWSSTRSLRLHKGVADSAEKPCSKSRSFPLDERVWRGNLNVESNLASYSHPFPPFHSFFCFIFPGRVSR